MKRKWIFADWKLPDQTDLNLIREWLLVQLGFKLGNFGPKGDGVDGDFGKKSQKALDTFRQTQGLPTGGMYSTADLTALVNRFRAGHD